MKLVISLFTILFISNASSSQEKTAFRLPLRKAKILIIERSFNDGLHTPGAVFISKSNEVLSCSDGIVVDRVKGDRAGTGYIRMQFLGVSDKPYTTAIFYLSGSVDTSFENFVEKFEVSDTELNSIKKIIEETDFNTRSEPIPDVFEFAISEDGKMKYYPTRYTGIVMQILNKAILLFSKTNKDKKINDTLSSMMLRLGIK